VIPKTFCDVGSQCDLLIPMPLPTLPPPSTSTPIKHDVHVADYETDTTTTEEGLEGLDDTYAPSEESLL